MAIRDKLRSNAAPYLQPGEQIQAVMCAQTVTQYLALVSIWIILLAKAYRVIVVTDRRILVCHSGRMRMTPITGVQHEVARQTVIGPPSGLWFRSEALGQRLYINRRYFKDIEAADAAIGVSA